MVSKQYNQISVSHPHDHVLLLPEDLTVIMIKDNINSIDFMSAILTLLLSIHHGGWTERLIIP